MACHRRNLITLVILSSLLTATLSKNSADMYQWDKWNFFPTLSVYVKNDIKGGLRLHSTCYANGNKSN
ncbi:PREDICTED: uncharacterized protein LOC104729057 [Camelina sativa]|uniref:Uncharacterized protein LOC104729057 n=1 Tax=Camelina sativa TaxID=90675 RepID=A0ABM0UTT4_CAMSA|nr:PREDICTED: uncharacterized protein LOC104729057 [Camelina sativa]